MENKNQNSNYYHFLSENSRKNILLMDFFAGFDVFIFFWGEYWYFPKYRYSAYLEKLNMHFQNLIRQKKKRKLSQNYSILQTFLYFLYSCNGYHSNYLLCMLCMYVCLSSLFVEWKVNFNHYFAHFSLAAFICPLYDGMQLQIMKKVLLEQSESRMIRLH